MTYEVQVSVLSQIQEKNFDHPIFCCLNPRGEIQPGTTARILWIFSPIEAKTYTVSGGLDSTGKGWCQSCDFLAVPDFTGSCPASVTSQVDVPIHILGWNSAVIRFQGVGYDPHVMGDTAPFHNISSWDNSSIYSRLMVPGQVGGRKLGGS